MTHARGAPHYAAALRRPAVVDRRALRRLPLLAKADAAEIQERLVVHAVPEAPPAYGAGVVSSATTRLGRPLRVQLAAADVDGSDVVSAGVSVHQPDPHEAMTLEIVSPRHGLRIPGGDRTVVLAALHPNTVDVTTDLLASRRFRTLVAPLSTLKWLTVALDEHALRSSGIEVLGCTGYPVTAHSRRFLERTWRAVVVDNWSMSELRGYAAPCRCGFCHWVGASTFFELIDPLALTPQSLRTGAIGELVATTLVPHGARMPLIRYRSGDVVEVGPVCRRAGTRGMRFLGRVSQSLFREVRGRARPVLLGRELLEVIEPLDDVAFEPHPAERLSLVGAQSGFRLGVPRARLVHLDGDAARLDVEMIVDPRREPQRADAVRAAIGQAFRQRAGRVELRLASPGSLDFHKEARKL